MVLTEFLSTDQAVYSRMMMMSARYRYSSSTQRPATLSWSGILRSTLALSRGHRQFLSIQVVLQPSEPHGGNMAPQPDRTRRQPAIAPVRSKCCAPPAEGRRPPPPPGIGAAAALNVTRRSSSLAWGGSRLHQRTGVKGTFLGRGVWPRLISQRQVNFI